MKEHAMVKWVVLGAVLLLVLNVPAPISRPLKHAVREGFAPLQGLITDLASRVRGVGRLLGGADGGAEGSRSTQVEMASLRNQIRALQEQARENSELRALLGFRERSERPLIGAEVIGRDMSGWWHAVRLDKGGGHGVVRDAAVITDRGLVGRTIAVSPRTSDVLLLSDPACRVSVRVVRPRVFGVLSGQGMSARGQVSLALEFVNKDREVEVGDRVVTSGLGGVFPGGVLVGHVETVELDESGLYQRATVTPEADLGGLTMAFVMVPEGMDPAESLLLRKRSARDGGAG